MFLHHDFFKYFYGWIWISINTKYRKNTCTHYYDGWIITKTKGTSRFVSCSSCSWLRLKMSLDEKEMKNNEDIWVRLHPYQMNRFLSRRQQKLSILNLTDIKMKFKIHYNIPFTLLYNPIRVHIIYLLLLLIRLYAGPLPTESNSFVVQLLLFFAKEKKRMKALFKLNTECEHWYCYIISSQYS